MKIIIYRGSKEIGGTLLEVKSKTTRILIDVGYPLFLNNKPIERSIEKLPVEKLLELGVLPDIKGLYKWDKESFDAVIISHAHIDHYGLLKYINPNITIYCSSGTKALIEISQKFNIVDAFDINNKLFKMYESFMVGDMEIKPYLMDHSAFDSAAFEIKAEGKTLIYTGDFRAHGRKAICLDRFIKKVTKEADILITEGTMFGRQDEEILSEQGLEDSMYSKYIDYDYPMLFQSSSQNIDRIVTFYRLACRLKRTFIVDVYTANILYELRQLENNKLPYPSDEYSNIKVFYPYRITQKLFKYIGEKYAKRFSAYHMSKPRLQEKQNKVIMLVRPSMLRDLKLCNLKDGVFIYSMWQGYRDSDYQQRFENYLLDAGFNLDSYHTSGHSSIKDIKKLIEGLNPKVIIPIHTMVPEAFLKLSNKVKLLNDREEYEL